MKLVASTASTHVEPSQKNTLKTNDPLTFAFEEPSKQRIFLRKLTPQFLTLAILMAKICPAITPFMAKMVIMGIMALQIKAICITFMDDPEKYGQNVDQQ